MSSHHPKSRREHDRDFLLDDLTSGMDLQRSRDLWNNEDVLEQLDDMLVGSSSDHQSKSSKDKNSRVSKAKSGSSSKANTSHDAVCHICGSRFSRRSNMYKHIRSVHSETREYVCKTCGFPFKRQDHLDKHVKSVHYRVKSYSCDICGDLFSEKYNRDKHKKTIHETKRPYRCKCGAYFQGWDKMRNCQRCRRS